MIRTILAAAIAVLSLTGAASAAESLPLSELDKQTHYHGLAVDPTDPTRLYLATHHGFYLVAANGVATRLSPVQDFMGFTPHPTDPSILYASGHPSGGGNLGFLISADGGANWTQLSAGFDGPVDFHQMDVSPADPQVIYGAHGGIQVSRDGGRSWSVSGLGPDGLIALAASAAAADRLYAATRSGILVSEDGGARWRVEALPGEVISMVTTGPDGLLYAYAVGRGLMQAHEDSPAAWSSLSRDNRILLHLAIDARDPARLFAVAHEAGILQSKDGGKSWRRFGEP